MPDPRMICYYASADPPPVDLLKPYTHVILCFLHPHEDPDMTLFIGNTPLSQVPFQYWDNVGILRSQGIQVLMSIGGWRVGDWVNISKNIDLAVSKLIGIYQLGLDGFDFDWEDWPRVPLPYNPTDLLMELSSKLRDQAFQLGLNPPLLTTSPITGHVDQPIHSPTLPDYLKIINNPDAPHDWMNVQFYEGGSPLSTSLFSQIVATGYPASKIVAGVKATGTTGKFPCDLLKTMPAIRAKYPDAAGMAVWHLQITGPNWVPCMNDALTGTGSCPDCAGDLRGT